MVSGLFPALKRRPRLLTAVISAFLAGLVISGLWAVSSQLQAASAQAYAQLRLLVEALYEIDNKYVKEKDNQDLIYGAIRGMVASLDSNSSFLTPADYQELLAGPRPNLGTAGLELCIKDNVLTVIAPLEGGPAWQAGIRPDDHILKINQQSTRNLTVAEAAKKLQGPPGTVVQLQIIRNGLVKPVDIKVTLAKPTVPLVTRYQLGPGQLYLRVRAIEEAAVTEVRDYLKTWLAAGNAPGIILDLRQTAGGDLEAARKLASLFVGPQLIYTLKGRGDNSRQTVYGLKNLQVARNLPPLVVLVDQGTAQAAEVVAAALQAHSGALLLGSKTFGNCGQTKVFPLKDGSAISINVAYCYTPKDRLIQGQGLEPDVTAPEAPEARPGKDLEAEDRSGRKLPDLQQVEADPLVKRAQQLLQNRPKGQLSTKIKTGRGKRAASVPVAGDEIT